MESNMRLVKVVFVSMLLMILSVIIYAVILTSGDYSKAKFCDAAFYSPEGETKATTTGVKEGFIRCCRDQIKDALLVTECKLFEYGD